MEWLDASPERYATLTDPCGRSWMMCCRRASRCRRTRPEPYAMPGTVARIANWEICAGSWCFLPCALRWAISVLHSGMFRKGSR